MAIVSTVLGPAISIAGPPTLERQQELLYLLRHDCGSCHGMRMTGGLGPALTPNEIAKISDKTLVSSILYGRPGTPMPRWSPLLTQSEVVWMVAALRQGIGP